MKNNMNKNVNSNTLIRRIASIALISVFSLATLCFTACSTKSNTDTNDTNGGDNGATAKYSQILQNVLESEYYDSVVDEYEGYTDYLSKNLQGPIPYTFLNKQGHDIYAIKNNTLECNSVAYTKNGDTNTLYLATRVENADSTPYYTCYVLKYSLTDKEYEDLYMLHNRRCVQAGLFIQELDAQKTAQIESKANVTVESYNKLVENRKGDTPKYFNTTPTVDLTKIKNDNMEIEINVRDNPNDSQMIISNCKQRQLTMTFYYSAGYTFENNILNINLPINGKMLNKEDYYNNYESITYFDSQSARNIYILNEP